MTDFRLRPSSLNRTVRIERPVADTQADGAGSGEWEPVATVRAEVQDMLPSRAERFADGMNVSARPARVRMWWRGDITSDMRIVMGERIMQIIAGPVELGRRNAIEMMVENYSTAGNPA